MPDYKRWKNDYSIFSYSALSNPEQNGKEMFCLCNCTSWGSHLSGCIGEQRLGKNLTLFLPMNSNRKFW